MQSAKLVEGAQGPTARECDRELPCTRAMLSRGLDG